MNEGYPPQIEERLRADSREIVARYPVARSALMPMLHLVQSVDGFVSPRGIALCADVLGLTRAEVSAVATFYSQYRRHPNGEYNVGVCTNALCAVMGGDEITLEALECNAGCDYAPVVMVNWEFFDNQTPTSALQIVEDIRAGRDLHPTRGADKVHTFKETERVLAGFEDGHADEGPGAGCASLRGLEIARERGWSAPKEVAK